MAIENKLKRVSHDAAHNRCQKMTSIGQCFYEQELQSTFCKLHGGNNDALTRDRQEVRNYRLEKWQARVGEFADSDKIKSIREEIGILRMILEEFLCQCKDSHDLLLFSPRITDLTMKLEKLVSSCDRLETKSGMLLDKSKALQLASKMVEIISKYVVDGSAVDKIASEIAVAILGTEPE